MLKKKGWNKGFTLVEIIIVIIILGILAALAIPQFTTSTSDAIDSTLAGNLAVMRNAIQLYQAQHGGKYPGEVKEDGTGTDTVAGDLPAAFLNQMLMYTKPNGETNTDKDPAFPHGPYLQAMPPNPLNDSDVVLCVISLDPLATADVAGTIGWVYSVSTGEIRATNAAIDDILAD